MRNPVEIAKNLGPGRAQELIDAYAAHQAAKATIASLQAELATHRQAQSNLAPAALIAAGGGVAELATGQATGSAHAAMIDHLTSERIPAAQRTIQATGAALNKIVEGIQRKERHIEEQRSVIDRAQAEVEKAQSWLDA
jgi:hypothetical protein